MSPVYATCLENREHWKKLADQVDMGLTWIDAAFIERPVEQLLLNGPSSKEIQKLPLIVTHLSDSTQLSVSFPSPVNKPNKSVSTELNNKQQQPTKSILKTINLPPVATSAPTSPRSEDIKTATRQLTRQRSMSLSSAMSNRTPPDLKPLRSNRYYRSNPSKLCTIS